MAAPDVAAPGPEPRGGRSSSTPPGSRTGWRRRWPVIAAVVVLALLVVDGIGAAVGSSSRTSNAGNDAGTPASPADTQFSSPGPYAVGTVQFTLPNGDPVQVWYPATPAAVAGRAPLVAELSTWEPRSAVDQPALADLPGAIPTDSYQGVPVATDTTAGGGTGDSFPVVLLSQGYGSYPLQSSFLTDHLASWGFVVASPENQASDLTAVLSGTATDDGAAYVTDLDDTVELLQGENTGSLFHHLLHLSDVGVVGQSGGGSTAITLADDATVRTYVALAPDGGTPPPTPKPGLVLYGADDTVVQPSDIQQLYAKLPPSKRLVVLQGTGHDPFDGLCDIHRGTEWLTSALAADTKAGGVLGRLAQLAGGHCQTPASDPTAAWSAIDQATTAQLRYGLGVDRAPVGLGTGLDHAFAGITLSYYQKD